MLLTQFTMPFGMMDGAKPNDGERLIVVFVVRVYPVRPLGPACLFAFLAELPDDFSTPQSSLEYAISFLFPLS